MSTLFYFFAFLAFSRNIAIGEDLLELGCLNDQQCKQFERSNINASCVDSHCICSETNSNAADDVKNVKCTPQDLKISNIIGGHCPCHMPQAECKEDVCYCAQGYVASADKRRCIPRNVRLNEECEMSKQCHAADSYAICDDIQKVCKCQTNFVDNNGTCFSVAAPDVICHNNSDCSTYGSNVVCLNETKQCVCNEDHVKAKNSTVCLPLVAYQENCTEDQQCLKQLGPGGSCINGSCECKDMHYIVQKQTVIDAKSEKSQVICTRIIQIGESCNNDTDCYHLQLPVEKQTMTCKFGECNCKYGYYSINNLECVRGSFGNVNSYSVWTLVFTVVMALEL